ncbi:MAG: methylated-DNA--[protein]-cysteine S-methyltransferase [Myxococcota bacterium]|nr:methylated-DNA--[protein]-cysteine S-methyltransferase [Myxococcota bacterium]
MPTLYTTRFASPIGELTIASSDQGLVYLALPRANGRGFAGWCTRYADDAKVIEEQAGDPGRNRQACDEIEEFLAGGREVFGLPLDLRATDFQLEVYRAVAEIPYGECLSYGDVARRLERPSAMRAVGAANGANPIPLVIPCHRVVASSGQLHGYAGGLKLKRTLLTMEAAARPAQGAMF